MRKVKILRQLRKKLNFEGLEREYLSYFSTQWIVPLARFLIFYNKVRLWLIIMLFP